MDNLARLQTAREIVTHLEAGDEGRANELLNLMASSRDNGLFREVGRMTRTLHDALVTVNADERIVGLAQHDIPDARQRLNYVIQKTEEAANRTLSAVEALLPISEKLGTDANNFTNDWTRFTRRELSMEEFRQLSDRLMQFLASVRADSGVMHKQLSDVLMAQDFQDLTGQVIRRVISLVNEVESNLVQLIRCAGTGVCKPEDGDSRLSPEGPQVEGTKTNGAHVNGQDEVDDLLSSLGF